MMFKTYCGPLLLRPPWYELPLGTFRSADFSMSPTYGEEHNMCNDILLYKDTMHEDAMELCDPLRVFVLRFSYS